MTDVTPDVTPKARPLTMPPPAQPERLDEVWRQLGRQLRETLARVAPDQSRVVLLDYPVYRNIGDMLIYAGTRQWLRDARMRVERQATIDNFRFPRLPRDVIILCHGGGNFGDLYRHQTFRERVVARYPGHRVVVMPQSIYFANDANARRSGERLRRHDDLHIFVRDAVSQQRLCNQLGLPSTLAPDMATLLYRSRPAFHPAPAESDRVLMLLRRDREALIGDAGRHPLRPEGVAPDAVDTADWRDLFPGTIRRARAAQLGLFAFGRLLPADSVARRWSAWTDGVLDQVAQRLRAYRAIVTSRLHGHLFASLLGVPNVVLDNDYGKLSSYFEAWSTAMPMSRLHSTRDEPATQPAAASSIGASREPG